MNHSAQIEKMEEQIAALHKYTMAFQGQGEIGAQTFVQAGMTMPAPQHYASSLSWQYHAKQALNAGWMVPKQSRWTISPKALKQLEHNFSHDAHPSPFVRKQLAKELNVTNHQVQVWFQNRRQQERKLRREKNTEDLKSMDVMSNGREGNLGATEEPGDLATIFKECERMTQHAQRLSAKLDKALSNATNEKAKEANDNAEHDISGNPAKLRVPSPSSDEISLVAPEVDAVAIVAQVVPKCVTAKRIATPNISSAISGKRSGRGTVVAAMPASDTHAQPLPTPAKVVSMAEAVPNTKVDELSMQRPSAVLHSPVFSLAAQQPLSNPNSSPVQQMPMQLTPTATPVQAVLKRPRIKKASTPLAPGPLDIFMAQRHQQGNDGSVDCEPDKPFCSEISPPQTVPTMHPDARRLAPLPPSMLSVPAFSLPLGSVPAVPPCCDPVVFAYAFATAVAQAAYQARGKPESQVDSPCSMQQEERSGHKRKAVPRTAPMASWRTSPHGLEAGVCEVESELSCLSPTSCSTEVGSVEELLSQASDDDIFSALWQEIQ